MLVEFPVEISFTDPENFGSVPTVTMGGFESHADVLSLRLFQRRQSASWQN